jgi:hypothetical protein
MLSLAFKTSTLCPRERHAMATEGMCGLLQGYDFADFGKCWHVLSSLQNLPLAIACRLDSDHRHHNIKRSLVSFPES